MPATHVANRGTAGDANTIALTSPASIAVGNLLVLHGYCGQAQTLTSITDPRGNTWTVETAATNGWSGRRGHLASCRVSTAYQAGDSLTLNGGMGGTRVWAVEEFSGIAVSPAQYRDGAVGTPTAASNSSAANSGNLTPTVANALLVGMFGWTLGGSTWTASGYTMLTTRSQGNEKTQMGWRVLPVAAAENFDGSMNGGGNSVALLAAFRPQPNATSPQAVIL